MGSKGISIGIKIALFALGMAILVLGLILLMPRPPAGTPAAVFISCDLVVLYALSFGPLLVGDSIEGLSSGRVIGWGIYYKALGIYALFTVVAIVLAVLGALPLVVLVVAQLVGLFGLALGAYSAMATSGHVEDVRQYETGVRGSIERLRSTSERLAVRLNHFDAREQTQKELVKAIDRIAEELRYTSPLHTPEAYALEEQIAAYLDALDAATSNPDMSAQSARTALDQAQGALLLIEQRKALRN